MHHTNRFHLCLPIASTIVLSSAALIAGCSSQPKQGDPAGRVDPYKTTNADLRSSEISTVSLLEFSDQVAQSLVKRISTISEITDRPNKIVLELGSIRNETRTGTHDYHQIRRRIMSRMVNSDILRQHADVLEMPEIMDGQNRRLGTQAQPDLLDEGTAVDNSKKRYSDEITYVLNGYFGEQVRGGGAKSQYYLQMTLSHLGSRRIVFSDDFDLAQVR